MSASGLATSVSESRLNASSRPARRAAAASMILGTGNEARPAVEPAAQGCNHLGDAHRFLVGDDEGAPQCKLGPQHRVDRGGEVFDGKKRALGGKRAERQREPRAGEFDKSRHVAFHAGAVDEHRAQRDPVEVEFGKAAFRFELRASVGLRRRRFARPPSGLRSPRHRTGRGSRKGRRSGGCRRGRRRGRDRRSPAC